MLQQHAKSGVSQVLKLHTFTSRFLLLDLYLIGAPPSPTEDLSGGATGTSATESHFLSRSAVNDEDIAAYTFQNSCPSIRSRHEESVRAY